LELILLGGAFVVPLAVFIGLWRWNTFWWIITGGVIGATCLIGAAVARDDLPRRSAAVGAATVAVVLSALLVAGATVATHRPETPWQRFGLFGAAALAALLVASVDWSRRWLLRLTIALAGVAVILLVQIGQADLKEHRERRVLLTLSDALHEGAGLHDADDDFTDDKPAPPTRDRAAATFDAALARACVVARDQALLKTSTPPTAVEITLEDCPKGTVPAGAGAGADASTTTAPAENTTTTTKVAAGETTPSDLTDALYQLDVALARFRFLTTGEAADRKAIRTALNADPAFRTTSYAEAAGHGPDALLESLTGSDQADRLTPGPVGWLALAAVALLGWGALLGRNARQLAGPVLVQTLEAPESYDPDLRIAVLENVSEPGAVPGADITTSVTELLALNPAAKGLSKAVEAVFTVVGQSYGYRVEVVVDEPGTPPAGEPTGAKAPTRVLVMVKDLRSLATLGGHVEQDPDTGLAVRAAGLWAAGFILGRSTRVPSWAAWTAETSRSLAASREPRLRFEDLVAAVQGSPNSGMLLVTLGQRHELKGQRIEAVDCYAQAVAAHPTYLLAQYRLAAAVAMLGRPPSDTWARLGPQRCQEIIDGLRRACRTLPPKEADRAEAEVLRLSDAPEPERSNACYRFAIELLREVEHQTGFLGLMAMSLRREDRDDRMPMLWSTGPTGRRQRAYWLAKSARLSCTAAIALDMPAMPAAAPLPPATPPGPPGTPPGPPPNPPDAAPVRHDAAGAAQEKLAKQRQEALDKQRQEALDELRAKAIQRGTWWQVGYNAACAHCLAGQPGTAITLLEECLLHPGSDHLRANWLRADPDLKSIRDSPRFERLVARVAKGD
jgi:tetratricopeptide (TPR) repeat protein